MLGHYLKKFFEFLYKVNPPVTKCMTYFVFVFYKKFCPSLFSETKFYLNFTKFSGIIDQELRGHYRYDHVGHHIRLSPAVILEIDNFKIVLEAT